MGGAAAEGRPGGAACYGRVCAGGVRASGAPAGCATTQAAYSEEAVDALITALDALEQRLARRRFLLGDQITEMDVRLYPDPRQVRRRLPRALEVRPAADVEHPNLRGHARDLYQRRGFGDTTDFGQIKRHYFQTQTQLNPTGIVPKRTVCQLARPAPQGPPTGTRLSPAPSTAPPPIGR